MFFNVCPRKSADLKYVTFGSFFTQRLTKFKISFLPRVNILHQAFRYSERRKRQLRASQVTCV